MKRFTIYSLLVFVFGILTPIHAQSDAPIPAVFYVTSGYDYHVATLDPQTFQATPVCEVTGYSLTNVLPSPSPDGGALALTMFAGEFGIADYSFIPTQQNSFIYHCDLATGVAERLSLPQGDVLDSSPTFSPDGTQLAWLRIAASDNIDEPTIEVIVYDRPSGTETVITTLNTQPRLGVGSGWVDWGPGGIAIRDHMDSSQFGTPLVSIYTDQGEFIMDSSQVELAGGNAIMREWALLNNQPVYILAVQSPPSSTRRNLYTVLNPASGEAEVIEGDLVKSTLDAGGGMEERVLHVANRSIQVGLLNKRYQHAYDLAIAPPEDGLLVIDFSSMLRGGQLYYVNAADLPQTLGAVAFPVTPIAIPGIVPGEGGVMAVYWQVDVWQFSL